MDKAQPSELVEKLRRYVSSAHGKALVPVLPRDLREAADLIERLTPTPEPCRLREALVEARNCFGTIVDALNDGEPRRVEYALERSSDQIAKIDSAISASPAEPEEATEAMIEAARQASDWVADLRDHEIAHIYAAMRSAAPIGGK